MDANDHCRLHISSLRRRLARRTIRAVLLVLGLCRAGAAQTPMWIPEGPGPNTLGQVENIHEGEVTGAISTVAPHPTDADIVYVGTVNGGIWKTANATAEPPNWTQQTDDKESLSIGALEFDPIDPSHQTLIAGTGRFSSLASSGGLLAGLLRTIDGGATWTVINGTGKLNGLNISGVAPRGQTIVISVNRAISTHGEDDPTRTGVWRTNNGGEGWTKVSGRNGSGLPEGASYCLASDPKLSKRLFTVAGDRGLYRSDNAGETWKKVSHPAVDALIATADNLKMSVGTSSNVFVAIDSDGELSGVFRSPDGGETWAQMELPAPLEGGIHPGRQGGTHLSIAADPLNSNIVYIGGDRQPAQFVKGRETDNPALFPNSIGAKDFSGRLFRGDASRPAGSQWVHLTHSNSLGPAGGGTANSSAPHADSRALRFTTKGRLIEVDDGGIYQRTSPQTNAGDWFSMNGNLTATEFHAVAWDDNCHLVVGGAQDTGTPEQQLRSGMRWKSVATGDGGVVAVDTASTPARSVRYSSFEGLDTFRREVYTSKNELEKQDFPELLVLDGGERPVSQFYTPIKLNSVVPTRLIIGAGNSVYESLDQGDTITEVGPGIKVNGSDRRISLIDALQGPNPIAYGAKDNPDVLYVGSGDHVFVRSAASPSPLQAATEYSGGIVLGIAGDPNEQNNAFVVSPHRVSRTTDGGKTWTDRTGNLLTVIHGDLLSITYRGGDPTDAAFVGSGNGVAMALGPAFSHWEKLGTGLPNAPVYHIEYNAADGILLAGTLGRGAWILKFPRVTTTPSQSARNATPAVSARVTPGGKGGEPFEGAGSISSVENPKPVAGFQLGPGIVVDPIRHRIYVMTQEGGIDAVDLASGRQLWASHEAAKPIGLVDGSLIGQAEVAGEANGLRIVSLEPGTGAMLVKRDVFLPAQVRASVAPSLKGNFVAEASPLDHNAVVSWEFVERPRQGIAPGTEPAFRGPAELAPVPPTYKLRAGSFQIDLKTGAVSASEATAARPRAQAQEQTVPRADVPVAGKDRRFTSADGRHFLVSTRAGDDSVVDKYTLTVHDATTGSRLGEFKSHLSVVPFFVMDSMIVYESGPYVRRSDKGLIEVPRRVLALDLKTGKAIWSLPVRDTAYRGPLPP